MVCCVSGGSGDSSNVGVIYRPLNKQASLPQACKRGPEWLLQKWGLGKLSGPKEDPGGPLSKMRVLFEFYFVLGKITDRESAGLSQCSHHSRKVNKVKKKCLYIWRSWKIHIIIHYKKCWVFWRTADRKIIFKTGCFHPNIYYKTTV